MTTRFPAHSTLLLVAAFGFVDSSNPAAASSTDAALSAVINVAPGAVAFSPGDSMCSLREAIINANLDSDTSGGDCPAGSGDDTIVLAIESTYSTSEAFVSGGLPGGLRRSVLPPITSVISIVGNGSIIERVGAVSMRVMIIDEDGVANVDDVTIKGGLLIGNGMDGAGIYNAGRAYISNSTVSDNEILGSGWGAGVFNSGGVIFPPGSLDEEPTLVLSNTLIEHNSISNVTDRTRAGGAGVFNMAGSFTRVEHSTVRNNYSEAPGAGIYHLDTVFELVSSTVAANTVNCSAFAGSPAGAGVYNAFGAMSIVNSTISSNKAECDAAVGAGIVAGELGGGVIITHSTVTANAGAGGKAVLAGDAIVDRSIIIANEADASAQSDCGTIAAEGTIDSRGFNVVGAGEGCPSSGPADEAVAPADAFTNILNMNLADNGGQTFTHALLDPAETGTANPAVDRIYRRACTELLDQRDEDRPADGDGDGDAECDSGAYELEGAPAPGGITGCQEPFPNEPTWEGTALTSVPGLVTLIRIPCGLLRVKLFDVFNLRVITYFIQDEQTSQFVDISQEFETVVDDKACISNQGLCVQSTWTGENGPYEDVYVLVAADNEQVPEGSLGLSVLDAINQFAEFEKTTLSLTRGVLPSEYDIFSFDTEQGIRNQVTQIADRGEFNPDWSRNGNRIVHDVVQFDPFGVPLSQDLYITEVATGVSTPLVGGEGGNDAAWSPKGDQILFDDFENLFLVDAEGGNPSLIRADAVDGSWYKKNRVIAYRRTTDNTIRAFNIDAGTEVIVASGTNPTWSKNGKHIAFASEGDLYVVDVDGEGRPQSNARQLTAGPSIDTQPTWSPNSRTIYFHSDRSGDFDLYTVGLENGEVKAFTGLPDVDDFDPDASNDGEFVAFSSVLARAESAIHQEAGEQTEATTSQPQVEDDPVQLEAYPNPFNPAVAIRFSIPEEGEVTLEIYDATGRLQAQLFSGHLSSGRHEVVWNADHMPSGVYFARFGYVGSLQTRAILMTK